MTHNAVSYAIMDALQVPFPHVTVGGSNRTGWRVFWHDDPDTPPVVLAGPARTARPMHDARREWLRLLAVAAMECRVCEAIAERMI